MKIKRVSVLVLLAMLVAVTCCFSVACKNKNKLVEINLSDTSLILDLYDRHELTAEVVGSQETVTFTSSNTNVVVCENGLLIPVADGDAKIVVSCDGTTAECAVTVADTGARPTLDLGFSETKLFVGHKKAIKPIIAYKGNAYEDCQVEYIADENTSVAVIENGNLIAKEKGNAEFTVKYSWRGFEDVIAINVEVKNEVAFGVESNDISLYTVTQFDGKTYQNQASVKPYLSINKTDIDNFTVEYVNQDDTVITVDDNGNISAKSYGSSVVQVKCSYNGEEFVANVNVSVDFPSKEVSGRYFVNLVGESKLDIENPTKIDKAVKLYDANKNIVSTEIENGKFELDTSNKALYNKDKYYVYTEDKVGYEISAEYVSAVIYDKQDLTEMRTTSAKTEKTFDGYYVLNNDIDFGGDIWTPWCSYYVGGKIKEYSFVGTFDGNGYSISNMVFNYQDKDAYAFKGNGFIGMLGRKGVIKNVSFINCETYNRTGLTGVIVCGANNGLIENVYVEMPANNFKVIENAKKVGYIFSVDEFAGRIENCFAKITGTTTDSDMVIYGASTMTVNTNVNIVGDVTAVSVKSGSPDNQEVKAFESVAEYTATNNRAYDSSVWNTQNGVPTLKNYRELIVMNTNIADLDLSEINIGDNVYYIPFETATPTDVTIFGQTFDFDYNSGKIEVSKTKIAELGTGEKGITISTADKKYVAKVTVVTKILKTKADIAGFQALTEANYENGVTGHYGGYYILGDDIDFIGYTTDNTERFVTKWKFDAEDPFKYGFYGTFDGRGHTISDLYILNSTNNNANTYASGLFGHVVGTVKNLCIKDPGVSIATMDMQGIVCGANAGEVSNVSVVFTKDITYQGTPASGIVGSIAVFGSYKYYQPTNKFGVYNNCVVVLENGVTNAKDIYFCAKAGTTAHNYTFNNCVAVSNGTATITTSPTANGSAVANYTTASGVDMSGFDTSIWNVSGNYPVLKPLS